MKRLGLVTVVLGFSLGWASLANAQATWSGGSAATWNNTSFWSTGSVPDASTAVVLAPSAGATMNITNGVIATATSIDFANVTGRTTTISIADGSRLNVGGAITDTGAGLANMSVNNTSSANAASILTATSIALDSLSFNAAGAQFLTLNSDLSLATQLIVGNASGTATYRQTGGTLTTSNGGYGLTLIEATSGVTTGTATFILDGGRVMSDRIGVANGNGNNGANTRYAANGSFVFNSGTVQPRSGSVTFFQNGSARTSGSTTDTQYDTSKPLTISLAGTGTHEFNATGGNIFITPSAQLRDKAGEAGTLLKTGTSSLILTGNGPVAVNDWTGASTVNNGTLSVDYNQIAGTATSGSTTALSNAYSAASQLVLNGGNFTLTGRPNATASSLTNVSMAANAFNATVSSTSGLVVGQAVTNANLPAGTYIRRIINGTTIELNAMSGTTAISGQTFNVAAASFTNSQTINSVSLQQSGTVTVNPAGDSTVLTFGTVAGSAGFTKAGTGLLVLSGSNTFSGGATLSAGTLALNNASALGTGTFTITGGSIDNTNSGAIALTQANPQAWNADFTFAGTRDLDLGTGAVTLSANRQVTTTAGVLAVGGAIGGGALNLTKAGNGMLRLTGSSAYSGTTAISAGTLQIGGGGTTGAIAAGAVSVASGGLLSFNRTDNYGGNFANVISGSGNVELLSGTLAFTGANTYMGTTTITGGQLSIGSGTNVGSIAGSITNNAALVFNRSNALAFGGVISGSGTVTKSGAGTLTLSGSSTYTGKTAVTGGGISINSIGNVNGGASALGNPDSVANGTIDLAGNLSYTGATAATDRRLNVGNGAATATIDNAGSGRLTLNGALAVNVTSAWSLNPTGAGSEILVNGLVSGNGGLFVNGATGTVTLANSSNSFSGSLSLYQGTVSIASMANSGSNSPLGTGSALAFGNGSFNMTGRLLFTGSAGASSNRSIAIAGGTAGTGFTNGAILENAVAGQTLTLSGNVTASGSTPSLQVVGAGDGVLSGNISDGAGDLAVTKSGGGTWTLSGSNAYSGATTVSQGTLRFGSVNSLNSTSGVSVAAGAVLAYSGVTSGTFTPSISGSGGLMQSGAGSIALSGSNGFTGATSLNAGTLALASANALAGTGTMSFGGGALQYGSANQTDFSSIVRNSTGAIAIDTNGQTVVFATTLDASNTGGLSKSGVGTLRLTNSTPGYSGTTTVSAGTLEFAPSSGSATLGSSVVGTSGGTLLKTGNGTTIIGGTGNTFAGALSVTGGTLQIGNAAVTNVATQGLASVASVNVGPGANLVFKNSTAINAGAPITLSGTISTDVVGVSGGNGFVTSLGALTMSGGSLISNLGANNTSFQSYALGGDVTVTGASPSTISAAAGSTQNGVHLAWVTGTTRVFNVADVTSSAAADLSVSAPLIDATSSLAASGVRKTGDGTMLISSTSTYSGATQVAAGTLIVNGRLANTSGVTVDAGATLGGSGVIAALATVNGTLSPGNSPGEITLSSLALGSTATTLIEITGTTRGSQYDGVTILTADGLGYGGSLSFDFGSLFDDNTTFDIFSFTGTPTGSFTSIASTGSYAGTWTNNNNGTYSLQQGSQTLTFSQLSGDVVIVPEPTALMLVGIGAGLGGVAAWRRRRAVAPRR